MPVSWLLTALIALGVAGAVVSAAAYARSHRPGFAFLGAALACMALLGSLGLTVLKPGLRPAEALVSPTGATFVCELLALSASLSALAAAVAFWREDR